MKISCRQVCNKLFFNQTLRFCFSKSTLLSVLKLDLFLYMWGRFFLMLFLSFYFFKTYFYRKITSTWVLYQPHNWIGLIFFSCFWYSCRRWKVQVFQHCRMGSFIQVYYHLSHLWKILCCIQWYYIKLNFGNEDIANNSLFKKGLNPRVCFVHQRFKYLWQISKACCCVLQ